LDLVDEKVEQRLDALKKKHGTEEDLAKYLKRRNLQFAPVFQ
jgi:hypothetical protein